MKYNFSLRFQCCTTKFSIILYFKLYSGFICIYQYFLAHETISKVQRRYHYMKYRSVLTLFSTLLGYSYRAKYCVIFSQRDIFILLHLISQYLNYQCIDDNVDKIQVCISMLSFKTVLPSKIPR